MTQVDNTKGFLGGKYADINVTVPANTEYKKYLVVGVNSAGNVVPYELAAAGTTAKGKMVFTANPTANDTITVATVTYKFVSALAAAGDVKIGATLTDTLESLAKTINGTATAGTDCYTGTADLAEVIKAVVSGSTLNLEALEDGIKGNYLALASSSANAAVTAFTGGKEADEKVIPAYILTQDLNNTSGSEVTYYNVRVFTFGTVNKKFLVFKTEDDANNAKTYAELKASGFDVVPVTELT